MKTEDFKERARAAATAAIDESGGEASVYPHEFVLAVMMLAWGSGYRDGTRETTDAFRELLPPDKTDLS